MNEEQEAELWSEFEKIEQMLDGKSVQSMDSMDPDSPGRKIRPSPLRSRSAYELAQAEGEKEILEDRLHELLSRTDEYNSQLISLTNTNVDLVSKNEKLTKENDELKAQLVALQKLKIDTESNNTEERFRLVEFKLAETKSRLARTLQTFDDLTLAKDFALKELEQERLMRIHAEKERDAYCAAYEASLSHFDRWTSKAKAAQQQQQQQRNSSSTNGTGSNGTPVNSG